MRDLQAVPQAIRKAYEAALKVKNVEPNAFAVLVGRALEIMCKCENVQSRVLAEKLRNLGDSGRIPQVLAQMALQLKQLRNLGAHVAEDEVKEEDVPIILEFVEAILEYLYVAPEKIAKVQARLDQVH